MPRHIPRIWIPLALLVGTSCGPAPRAPLVPLEPPPAPAELTVAYVRASDGTPLQFVRAFLICCVSTNYVNDTLKADADAAGTVRFNGLGPGHYVLRSAWIGHRMRHDTIIIGAIPPPKLQIAMQIDSTCLGACDPDPRLVAAARARRNEWGCTTDKVEVRDQKDEWISLFSLGSTAQEQLGVKMTQREVASRIVPITSRALCRRAAEYFDKQGTISTLDFTLFRFGRWILASPANEGAVRLVLDQNFRLVADFSVVIE